MECSSFKRASGETGEALSLSKLLLGENFKLSNVTVRRSVDLQRRKVKNTQDLVASQTFNLTVHLSFPMIHKVGNVVIFVLLWSKGIEPATLRP